MKQLYTILFVVVIASFGYAQTVSTFMNSPTADVDDALVFDSQGNLYGSNFAGNSVFKITPTGEVTTFVSGLVNPNGLAFDSQDNLFVADYGDAVIYKYDINGNLLDSYQIDGFPSGLIKSHWNDNIIFTTVNFTTDDNAINELHPDGSIEVLYEGNPLSVPVGLAFDKKGTLYIGNYLGREIYSLPMKKGEVDGPLSYVATIPDSGTNAPFLAFIAYAQGHLFATNYGENKIYKVHPKKIDDVEIYAGSTNGDMDGDVSVATFSYPAGLVANGSGNTLYVSEFSGLGNIRKITVFNDNSQDQSTALMMEVYPNPASAFMNVEMTLPFEGNFDIQIYNLTSKNRVYFSDEASIEGTTTFSKSISLEGWPSGLYELVVSNRKYTESKTIFVE